MSTLSREEILRRLTSRDPSIRLTITPLLSESQIQAASVDLRLGPWFVIERKRDVSSFDPIKDNPEKIAQMVDSQFVPYGRSFVLHPAEFVLASTLEYFVLPCDVNGIIAGRSSWGRLGLIVATAPTIHPGYKGIVTLELRNIGEVPIHIWPGWWIAQVIFNLVHPPLDRPEAGRYGAQTRPSPSRLTKDNDGRILEEFLESPDSSGRIPKHC